MDLDMLVAEADPARHTDLPGPDSAEAARLYHQITARAPRRRWTRPAVSAVVTGLVVVAAATALLLVNLPGSAGRSSTGQGGARSGSVAAILAAAAVAAGHGAGAGHPPGSGQYLYVQEIDAKGLSNNSTQACPVAPMTVHAWVAVDGSGRQIGTFPARCSAMDFDQTYTRGGLPWWLYGVVQADTLPTSSKALERAIVRRFEHGHSRPSATFVYAATFLNAGSTAKLRAALYRVIESLPGVQNLGPATDRRGRHGQAVGLVTSGTREVLIFDPASTVVLEREMVAVAPEQSGNNMLPAGTVMQYTEYLRAGVVNSDTVTPSATPGSATRSGTRTPATPAPRAGTASPSPSSESASPSPGAGTPPPSAAATPSSAGVS
jgi:hypothetical protein